MTERGKRRLPWVVLLGLTVASLLPNGALGAALHPKLLAKVGYGTVTAAPERRQI